MVKPDFKKFSKQVCDAMLIAPKENPGIEKAKKKYGRFVNKLLKKPIKLKDFTKAEQKKIKDLQKFKYGPLIAKLGSRLIVKKKVSEVVRITYVEADKDAVKLAKLIREECWRRGCGAALIPRSQLDSRKALKLTPKATLVEASPLAEILAKNIDVSIFIGYDEDINWSKGFEKELKLCAPFGIHIHKIFNKRKVRWCYLGLPVKLIRKKDYLVATSKYEKVWYNTLKQTYTKSTNMLCKYYKKSLERGNRVRITAKDGTDLSFSIKNRHVVASTGKMSEKTYKEGDFGLNIPDGEVYCPPIENSANGAIIFDFVLPKGFGLIKNLKVTFKDGKIVKYTADGNGTKLFKKFLAANTGEKDRIAELGIGTNKSAKYIGAILIDEKIFGTIHIAIGMNSHFKGGKNEASNHLDMIKVMKGKQGNLYVDGKLIMKNGQPV